MDTKRSDLQQWGSFALVIYIPDPLGSFLHKLRQSLPGDEYPRAHITILPPRPLKLALEAASAEAKRILAAFSRFTVRLTEVRAFEETSVLYLGIGQGSPELDKLHDALNSGDIEHAESFEFRPHLTISGSLEALQLASAKAKAEELWRGRDCAPVFEVQEIVALWQPTNGTWDEWNPVWSYELRADVGGTSAKAGVP